MLYPGLAAHPEPIGREDASIRIGDLTQALE